MKTIRKVIHHLPTNKEWFNRSVELTGETENEYEDWLRNIMMGKTVALTFAALITDDLLAGDKGFIRKMAFTESVLKECVVSLEVQEVNE